MQTIREMSECIDISTISTTNAYDDLSLHNGHHSANPANCVQTPVTTPEPKSVSKSSASGSRSEIHYPGVQNPSRIYESKKNRKIVRIMTVMAYMFAVSLAAIVLSLYYAFLWNPNMQINNSTHLLAKKTNTNSPEVVPLRQEADTSTDASINGSTKSDDTLENQVQNQMAANPQPILSSAHLVVSAEGQSESRLISSPLVRPPVSTTTANKRDSVYSSNILSSTERKQNVSKLLSNTYQRNVVNVSQLRIGSNIRNSEILAETDGQPLIGSNRSEINIIDNQIEISLNTTRAVD